MPHFQSTSITAALLLSSALAAFAVPASAGDAAQGAVIAQSVCVGCHGPDGNSPQTNLPKLASQRPGYLIRELQAFQSGKRPSEIMQALAASLSEADIANLAAYYASQPLAPGQVTQPKLLQSGKAVYFNGNPDNGLPSCDSCHGENGRGDGDIPSIAAQNVDYLHEELRRYATGQRPHGKRVMRTVAQRITPEEAEALAQFIASLR
jgi:cytochrome c553